MRQDLQILRGFSVLLVFIYHVDIIGFEGGFVGVDIFFVLSGFFTARMLHLKDHNLKNIVNFLNRRLVRLMPNLFFYILITIPIVLFYYPPHLLKDFGQSIVSNSILVPNIFFFTETDYYNDFARTAPLLHTWSLGVEVQYYFCFAILAYFLSQIKYGVHLALFFLSLLSLVSATIHINTDRAAVFYLLQYRFWELAAGYATFHLSQKFEIKFHKMFLLITSYGLLLAAGFFYSDRILFPAFSAVPVVLVSCVIILIKYDVRPLGGVGRFFVVIGNRAYSIYLSHNILISILTTAFMPLPVVAYLSAIVFGTALASEFSYRMIETNFNFYINNIRKFYFHLTVVTLTISSIGLHFHTTNGLRQYKLSQAQTTKYFLDYDELRTSRVQFVKEKLVDSDKAFESVENRILILGDSKSEDLFILMNAVDRMGTQYRRLRLDDNCMQPPGEIIINKICKLEHRNIMSSELLKDSTHVILTATWQRSNITKIVRFVSYLEGIGKTVAVVSTANFQDASSVALQLPKISDDNLSSIFYRSIRDDWRRQYIELKSELQKATSAQFFEKLDLFCSMTSQRCNLLSAQFQWLIYDSGHLTVPGFRALSHNIKSQDWGVFDD